VAITGFGVFERQIRNARQARNPRTGAIVQLKKTAVPKFRAGGTFKEVVSGAKKLAKAAPGLGGGGGGSAKKSTAKKSTAKKSTAKKASPAKKSAAKKTAKKSPAKKSAAKKTAKKTAKKAARR
jgi:DNA-binding protein HU-beta